MNAIAPMPLPAAPPPAREARTDSADTAAADPADKRFSDLLGDAPAAARTVESSTSKSPRREHSKDEPAEPENADAGSLLWLNGIDPSLAPLLTSVAGTASDLPSDEPLPTGDPAPVADTANTASANPPALPATPLLALLAAVDATNPVAPAPASDSAAGKILPAATAPAPANPANLAALALDTPAAASDKAPPLQAAQALPANGAQNFADEIKLATRLLQDLVPGGEAAQSPSSPTHLPAATELRPTAAPVVVPGPPADLRAANFDQQIGKHLLWLSEQRIDQATIQVSPEHLGPLEVRLRMDGDKVFAQFSSAHSEVRQVLETAMPRLRDMLGAQGLTLAQADVGQQGQWQQPAQSQDSGTPRMGPDTAGDSEIGSLRQTPRGLSARILRLLDEYA